MLAALRRFILPLTVLCCCAGAKAQLDTSIYITEISWQFTLPAGYKIVNGDFISKAVNVKTLLTATNAAGDFLYISIDSADKLDAYNWEASDQYYKVAILNAIGMQRFIDQQLSDGIYRIGGQEFKETKVDCTKRDHSILHLLSMGGFYRKHYILVNYFYHGDPQEIFSMLGESKFD